MTLSDTLNSAGVDYLLLESISATGPILEEQGEGESYSFNFQRACVLMGPQNKT